MSNPRANLTGTNGTRVRKNAKDLTQEEWARFINAVKGIKNRSRAGGVISIYDEFTALHMGAVEMHRNWRRENPDVKRNDFGNVDPSHDNPSFLAWHRQFLLEFENALQSVDPSVTLPYWDWTDREFNKKLFSPSYMGGNGGWDGKGGALVTGPFTLDQGWVIPPALHRNAWYSRGPNGTTLVDPATGTWKIQPSLGRSIIRYLGDFDDLATPTDIIEFVKRKTLFGPEQLVYRSDLIPVNPNEGDHDDKSRLPSVKPMPRGTLHVGDGPLRISSLPDNSWIKNRSQSLLKALSDDDNPMETLGDNDRSFREDVQGFRWAIEASPHMHNQTHDWFGYYTTILQDDELSGSSSMPNVACATCDPIFFLHHCNIDRLWAEWQDAGHYGSIFYPKRTDTLQIYKDVQSIVDGKPLRSYTYPQGHNLDDNMWPWDNNVQHTQKELQFMLPQYYYTLKPRNMLDYRNMGFCYDTSIRLAVNSVTPVKVYLPSTANKVTHQVFPLDIQRDGLYIISAWNTGLDKANLKIGLYSKYEEQQETEFLANGFKGQKIDPIPASVSQPERAIRDASSSLNVVYKLARATYYVVVTATVPKSDVSAKSFDLLAASPLDASYEIACATNPLDFKLPDIPIAPGIIANPQVPVESAVYIPQHRYAPVHLQDGVPQYRLTKLKGSHELFGIIVPTSGWFADIAFEGMDALVQLYGPFDEDNDSLPHFDDNGQPVPGDNATHLSKQLQIASSEGCCERQGSGISSFVTPGRYVLLIFHCSIGPNEDRPYKVTYNLYGNSKISTLPLEKAISYVPFGFGRSVNLLYRVTESEGKNASFVTKAGEIYKLTVRTDDPKTQEQVMVVVFTYHADNLPADYGQTPPKKKVEEDGPNVSYNVAYWGKSEVTFEPYENQVLFVRVTILNGYRRTKIKTHLARLRG